MGTRDTQNADSIESFIYRRDIDDVDGDWKKDKKSEDERLLKARPTRQTPMKSRQLVFLLVSTTSTTTNNQRDYTPPRWIQHMHSKNLATLL
jgi:hypothetical protein